MKDRHLRRSVRESGFSRAFHPTFKCHAAICPRHWTGKTTVTHDVTYTDGKDIIFVARKNETGKQSGFAGLDGGFAQHFSTEG